MGAEANADDAAVEKEREDDRGEGVATSKNDAEDVEEAGESAERQYGRKASCRGEDADRASLASTAAMELDRPERIAFCIDK